MIGKEIRSTRKKLKNHNKDKEMRIYMSKKKKNLNCSTIYMLENFLH